MYNRNVESQSFSFLGLGKIRLGLVFIAFVFLSSVIALMAISVLSAHFAYASAKTVPIPPKRPDVMSASPAYIRQLMARNNYGSDVYNDAFSYDAAYEEPEEYEYEEKIIASLQEDAFDAHKNTGIPVPGHKPSYGDNSAEQNIEDFSNNPSSVRLAMIDTETDAPAVIQPIVEPDNEDHEKALVSFTLDPKQVSLDPNLKEFLLEHAVKQFKNDPELRLEIHAYASTENNQEYSDVRRSLARALEVRSFLLEQNIDPSRLKITPMGHDSGNVTNDRIDLLFIVSQK